MRTDTTHAHAQEEDAIVIDRFDGRALLDDRALFMKKKSRKRCAFDPFFIL